MRRPRRRSLAAAFLAVRVLGRHDGDRRATRDGLLAAAFLAVRVLGRHDGDRRATRDGLLAAAFLAVRVLGRHDGHGRPPSTTWEALSASPASYTGARR